MDRADLCLFELPKGIVQPTPLPRSGTSGSARLLERFAQPEFELASGLLGKGDGNNLRDLSSSALDDANNSSHELGCFAGAGRGFDDQRVVERVGDQLRSRWSRVIAS